MQHDNIRSITSTFNTSKYSVDLGVVQSFVVSGDITWADGSSLLANEVYSVVTANSAGWGTNVAESGPKWDENYTTVNSLSDTWNSTTDYVDLQKDLWNENYTTVNSLSDTWGEIYNISLSAVNWNDVYESSSEWVDILTVVQTNSSDWAEKTNVEEIESNFEKWNDTSTVVAAHSADWHMSDDWTAAYNTVASLSDHWDAGGDIVDVYTAVGTNSGNWNELVVDSANWDDVYNFVKSVSGLGFANVDVNGKLLTSQVPDLSITQTYTTANPASVATVCSTNDLQQGDVIVVTETNTTLIAIQNNPTGTYNATDSSYSGLTRLTLTDGLVQTVNSKTGPYVELYPTDIDDTYTDRKWVTTSQINIWDDTTNTTQTTSASWDQAYDWMLADSPTNNTAYNEQKFVNVTGDTITGDLHVQGGIEVTTLTVTGDAELTGTTDTNNLSVSGTTNLTGDVTIESPTINSGATVTGDVTVDGEMVIEEHLRVKGDLTVDGNAYLQADIDGTINIGDQQTDTVNIKADISSDLMPSADNSFDIGEPNNRWKHVFALSGQFDDLTFFNLGVDGVTQLTGKKATYSYEDITYPHPELGYKDVFNELTGEIEFVVDEEDGVFITETLTSVSATDPGVVIYGDAVGLSSDNIFPDVLLSGDMVITGALSGKEAVFDGLTARNFNAEYKSLTIRDGDLTVIDGNIIQAGGSFRVEGDISHVDDENTYIRFQEDQMTFRCHDINFIRLSEYPSLDDVVLIGDADVAVNLRVLATSDENAFTVDGDTSFIGIGTPTPETKLHVASGQVQLAAGNEGGALMIPAGDSSTRVNKTGSIRWNSEIKKYEGYMSHEQAWAPLGAGVNRFTDEDEDTFLSVDAEEWYNSDVISIYTAGCSALTIKPNQTVIFSGDIQFDRASVFDTSVGNSMPELAMIETDEYIFLNVNGKKRAIRLYDIPSSAMFEERYETFKHEDIVEIGGEACSTGEYGKPPMGTIDSLSRLVAAPGYAFPTTPNHGSNLYIYDVEDRPTVRILKNFTIAGTHQVSVGEIYIIYQINTDTEMVLFYTEDGTQIGNTKIPANGNVGQNNGWEVMRPQSDLQYTRVPHADDSDGDGLLDMIDPDDDNDGIPDFGDPDHPTNQGAVNTDGDAFMDPYDPDDDNDGVPDEQDIDPLVASDGIAQEGDYDGDDIKDEFDPDHGLSHGKWDLFQSPEWQDIDVNWEALDGSP